MQKMVGVINDNLKSVINGIRTHRDDTEKKLNAINAKIDEKIKEASRHKTDVDASRALITSFENEIASLEKDLKELTERFADKNFVGILDAANKEINTRIIEKRAQINRYTDNIYVIYDNDEAGNKGAKNAEKIAKENKLKLKIKHPFPDGVDMDKWVQTHTAEEFFKIIDYNKDDFLVNKLNKILKGE